MSAAKNETPAKFPRTKIDSLSVSRMIIGTNWFLGYSHQSVAKDRFITGLQTRKNIAEILNVFFEAGIDTILGMPTPILQQAISDAQDRTGVKGILALTPGFDPLADGEAERAFDDCVKLGADIIMPHTSVTDRLVDKLPGTIRNIEQYSKMIRERGKIPGLSTHLPESIIFTDDQDYDVATYISIYNAIGFLMPIEVEWAMHIIKRAKKPVMTIKPFGAGRITPPIGLAFVWNTIRDIDMVTVGTTTPDEARECIALSLDYLSKRLPEQEMQMTRSKKILIPKKK